jgi:hypothetical protein
MPTPPTKPSAPEPISDSADDPLKATRELVQKIDNNALMKAAMAKALKAMEWQPGDKLPPA